MNTEHQEKVDRQVCANCGGTIKWNIAKQQLECASCRTPYVPETTVERVEEHDFDGYVQREGERVSFPEDATIVCGNEIGEYAMVGAGAVITKPVKPYALVVGNPARQVGWVSRNGHRLHFGPEGLAACPETGERYRLADGDVRVVRD